MKRGSESIALVRSHVILHLCVAGKPLLADGADMVAYEQVHAAIMLLQVVTPREGFVTFGAREPRPHLKTQGGGV